MPDVWVVNASPIITLAKIGHLDLLERQADEIIVPVPVAREVLAGPADDAARRAIESGWGHRVPAAEPPPTLTEWGLGAGDTSVLAVALDRSHATAILDDAAARSCARTFGVPVLGTIGVVLRAKGHALVPSAADIIRALAAAGLHLDDAVIRVALADIGERWII